MKGLIVSIAAATLLLATVITGYCLNSSDGAVIYATDCASCHGAGDAGIDANVKKTNAGQITKAFNHYTSMKNSILRTNLGVIGAGPKGQLTAKQKNALVANLQIYHGEDLYNQKFTDPSQSTWNCSNAMCHGSYDNCNISGTTYGKIVKSFKQNKLKNNPMAPLKTKYTLSELHLIAKALAVAPVFTNPTGGGTPSVDGATLYYMDCMPCHNGPISNPIGYDSAISAVANAGSASAGADLITNAINTNAGAGTTLGGPQGMGTQVLMNLSAAQIQAIATAIQLQQLPANMDIYSSPGCFGTGTGSTNHCHQGFENPPYPS